VRRNSCSHCLFGMIVLAVVLASGLTARAQTPTPTPPRTLEQDFFKNILSDQKTIWTAPLHVRRRDAKWIIPGGIGFMALVTTDRITGDEIAEFRRQETASRIVSYAGSVYGLGAMAGTLYLIGRKRNDARARETGLLSLEAMIDSLVIYGGLKEITQRARPHDGIERSEFFDGGSSFPSGHSTQAWAVAAVIANEYRHRRAMQIAAYGIASAVSVARFTGEKHYLSDVVAGSVLGYAIGKYVYSAHHRDSFTSVDDDGPVTESRRLAIAPQFNRRAHQYGLTLTWSF